MSELFGHKVVGVAASGDTSAAFTASGSMYTWGCGRFGKLGLGDNMNRDVPTRVALVPIHQSPSTLGSVSVPSTPHSRSVSPFVFPGAMSDTDDEDDGDGSDGSSDASGQCWSPMSDPNYGKVVGVGSAPRTGWRSPRGETSGRGETTATISSVDSGKETRGRGGSACHPGRVQVDWHLLEASVVVDGYFDGPLNDPPDIRFVSAAGGERHSVACDSEGACGSRASVTARVDPRMLYQNDDDDPTLHPGRACP